MKKILIVLFVCVGVAGFSAPLEKTDLLGEWNVVVPNTSDFEFSFSDFSELHYVFCANGVYRGLCSDEAIPLFLSECGNWNVVHDSLVLTDCCYSRNWLNSRNNFPLQKRWRAEKRDSSIYLYSEGNKKANIILQRSSKQLWMTGKELNEINFLFAGFDVDTFKTHQVIFLYPDSISQQLEFAEQFNNIPENVRSLPYQQPRYFSTDHPDLIYLQCFLDSNGSFSAGSKPKIYSQEVYMTWTFVGKNAKHRARHFFKRIRKELNESGLKSFTSNAGMQISDSTGKVIESGKGKIANFFDEAATVPPNFYLEYEPDFIEEFPGTYSVKLHWFNFLGREVKNGK